MAYSRKHRLKTSRLSKSWGVAVLFVLLFAGIGSYFVFQSKAASGITAHAAMYDWAPHIAPVSGDSYTMHWHLSIGNFGDLNPELPFTTKWTVTPRIHTANVSPTSGQFVTDANFGQNHSYYTDIYVAATATNDCDSGVEVRMSVYGKSGALLATEYAGSGPSGGGANCGGTPDPTPTPDPSPNPNPNPDPGPHGDDSGPSGSGTGSQGSGSGKTGTGTGGGSSGSTATKQGNKPNSTPSSSSQGNKNQTKLDPSPFYDGKQYNRGSESDSSFGGLFNKPTNGGIATGWYLLTGLVLLTTGAGYWWWRTKRKV